MALFGCGPVAVSLVTGMPVALVNRALFDCGHDSAATKPSNLAGRARGWRHRTAPWGAGARS
jgi:hypothetical protein